MTKKSYFLVPLAVLLLAGCNPFRTETYVDGLAMPLKEASTDSLLFDISLEYVVKGLEPQVMEAINSSILTVAFDMEEGTPTTVEETATRYRETLVDQYFTENEGIVAPAGMATWVDDLEGTFSDAYKGWRNYHLAYFSFRGGIHGVQTVTALVFDTGTGALLTEADLFAHGFEKPLSGLLYNRIVENLNKDDASLPDLVEQDWVGPNGNFSVGADGVEWFFQPYEIGAYALGVVTATLSWEELKPYLL